MKIKKVIVLLYSGCDRVSVEVEMPPPAPDDSCLVLHFNATRDTGADYVRTHFGIEPEVINARRGPPMQFSREDLY